MAYGIRNEYITKTKSVCYIASKKDSEYDDYGNEITQYDVPKKYFFNVKRMGTGSSDVQEYGIQVDKMKVAYIPKLEYQGLFKEFDKAYLDGIEPLEEQNNGDKANYRIYSVTPQNTVIRVVFLKIVKGEE